MGGGGKGNANETQMQEPGINSIATWLMENNRHAIMIVPQCPTDKTWQGTIQGILVALIRTYIDQGTVTADRVYILGGSMGGTADRIMKISNVETFLAEMDSYSAEYKLDIEEGWTHEDVCKNSYIGQRLTWVFQHAKDN